MFVRISRIRRQNYRLFSGIADIDLEYYCNPRNFDEIEENIAIRKGVGNIKKVLEKYAILKSSANETESYKISKDLYRELSQLPNRTHTLVKTYKDDPRFIKYINCKKHLADPLEFSEITKRLNLMRTDRLGYTCGHRSYYFLGQLAEMEEVLIKYGIEFLLKRNFQLISVPDILPSNILESCGMTINSDRTQIYSLDPICHGPDLYLSGTAEMAIAGLLMNTTYQHHMLPLKLAAVSRCYRAEASSVTEERGIYRVHQFTKLEMFAVTSPDDSDDMLEYLRNLQEELFTPLGIHMQVLDMPPKDLGAPAYRKYDIEAWLPGRKCFGEISSCSNCTDYQSRRLGIKYVDAHGKSGYAHTLNGTACAIPRMLIALIETHQNPKGKVEIPDVLRPFMGGKQFIFKNAAVPELKLLKIKK